MAYRPPEYSRGEDESSRGGSTGNDDRRDDNQGGSRGYNDRRQQRRDTYQQRGYNQPYRRGGRDGYFTKREKPQEIPFREVEDVDPKDVSGKEVLIGEIYEAEIKQVIYNRRSGGVTGLVAYLLEDSLKNEVVCKFKRVFCRVPFHCEENFENYQRVFVRVEDATWDKEKSRVNIRASRNFVNQDDGKFDREAFIRDLKVSTEFSECCSKWNCRGCRRLHPNNWFEEQSRIGFEMFNDERCKDLYEQCIQAEIEIKKKDGICFREVGRKRCDCDKFHVLDKFYRNVRNAYYERSYELMNLSEEERKEFSVDDFKDLSMISSSVTLFTVKEKEKVSENGERYDVFILLGLEKEHRRGEAYEDLRNFETTKMHFNSFGGWNDVLPRVGEKKYDLDFQESALREFKEEVLIGERFKWKENVDETKSAEEKEESEESEGENEDSNNNIVGANDKKKYGKDNLAGKVIQCFSERKKYALNNYPVFAVPCEYFDIEKELKPVIKERERDGEFMEKTNFCWLKVDEAFFDSLKGIVESYEVDQDDHGIFRIKNTRGFQKKYMEGVKKGEVVQCKGDIVYAEGDVQGKDSRNHCGVDENDRNGAYSLYDLTCVQTLGFEKMLRDAAKNGVHTYKDILVLDS